MKLPSDHSFLWSFMNFVDSPDNWCFEDDYKLRHRFHVLHINTVTLKPEKQSNQLLN